MQKKQDLPQKICLHCGLPFSWRKKWERDWEQVRYCSKRCSGAPSATAAYAAPAQTGHSKLPTLHKKTAK
ncbi:MAG: hypothetical protein ACJA1Y_000194 [Burkholderiaceae bacterium]|jgi:hypothetical protein